MITNFEELTKELVADKTYALLVLRDGSARFLALKAEKPAKVENKIE